MRGPIAFLTLTFAACVAAAPEGQTVAPEGRVIAAEGLEEFAWLAGAWIGGNSERRYEEHWTPPAGGTMFGVHRDIRSGKTSFFEYLHIEDREEGVVFMASPAGAPATPFWLEETSDKRVVFVNPDHDFPKRVLYWIDDEGFLHGRADQGEEEGRVAEWVFERGRIEASADSAQR